MFQTCSYKNHIFLKLALTLFWNLLLRKPYFLKLALTKPYKIKTWPLPNSIIFLSASQLTKFHSRGPSPESPTDPLPRNPISSTGGLIWRMCSFGGHGPLLRTPPNISKMKATNERRGVQKSIRRTANWKCGMLTVLVLWCRIKSYKQDIKKHDTANIFRTIC